MKIYVIIIVLTILFFSMVQIIDDSFTPKMEDKKWGYHKDWCENMTWTESFRLNHNTTRTIFHQYCRI